MNKIFFFSVLIFSLFFLVFLLPRKDLSLHSSRQPITIYRGPSCDDCRWDSCKCVHYLEELPMGGLSFCSKEGNVEGIERSINLTKTMVLNLLYENNPCKIDGSDWNGNMALMSMIGQRRLNNVQSLVEDTLLNKIPGDFLEAGDHCSILFFFVFRLNFPKRNLERRNVRTRCNNVCNL